MDLYQKRPIIVEAIEFTSVGFHVNREAYPMVQDKATLSEMWFNKSAMEGRYYVQEANGSVTLFEGDYIVRGLQGEHYVLSPAIFHLTYEKVKQHAEVPR